MSASERGRLGGLAVLRKYGQSHFKRLNGMWQKKYQVVPVGSTQYGLVLRSTGAIIRVF